VINYYLFPAKKDIRRNEKVQARTRANETGGIREETERA
jgi:hypothetical protein